MPTIHEKFKVPANTPFVEATSDHADPFFSRPIAVKVTRGDVKEAKIRNGTDCAIACAVKNSSQAVAVAVQSRTVYLLRRHPKDNNLVISKHQLSKAGTTLVKRFDKTGRAPAALIELIPMPKSWTTKARAATQGTGKKHGPRVKIAKIAKRPKWLRARFSPGPVKG